MTPCLLLPGGVVSRVAEVAYINACALLQIADTKSITEDKGDARQKLIASIIDTLALLTTYSFLSGNTALVTECDLPDSYTAHLDDLKLDTYNLLLGSPRTAIGGKKAATENLKLGLDEAQELLEKGLNKLTTQFKGTDFHKEYWSAGKSINTAVRHKKTNENSRCPTRRAARTTLINSLSHHMI